LQRKISNLNCVKTCCKKSRLRQGRRKKRGIIGLAGPHHLKARACIKVPGGGKKMLRRLVVLAIKSRRGKLYCKNGPKGETGPVLPRLKQRRNRKLHKGLKKSRTVKNRAKNLRVRRDLPNAFFPELQKRKLFPRHSILREGRALLNLGLVRRRAEKTINTN